MTNTANIKCPVAKAWRLKYTHREGMLFSAGFGRYLAALEIIRQNLGTDLLSKSAATPPHI